MSLADTTFDTLVKPEKIVEYLAVRGDYMVVDPVKDKRTPGYSITTEHIADRLMPWLKR